MGSLAAVGVVTGSLGAGLVWLGVRVDRGAAEKGWCIGGLWTLVE